MDRGTFIILFAFGTLICAGFSISALVISQTDGRNSCQHSDQTTLSLQYWLLGYAIADFAFILLLWIYVGERIFHMDSFWTRVCTVIGLMGWMFFKIAWLIIGVVILVRSHSKCLTDGQDIGVMTLLAMIFYFLPVSLVPMLGIPIDQSLVKDEKDRRRLLNR